jgi:hypothetical protein
MTIPNELDNDTNRAVLGYIVDKSAHDGVAEALLTAVRPLGDVRSFSPDQPLYSYVVVSTKGTIFGLAVGMDTVAFRLDEKLKSRGLATGGVALSVCGSAWVSFIPFRDDWPKVDLEFWARKAYVFARETQD